MIVKCTDMAIYISSFSAPLKILSLSKVKIAKFSPPGPNGCVTGEDVAVGEAGHVSLPPLTIRIPSQGILQGR